MKPLAYDRKVFGIYSAFCARKFKIMREAFPELHKRIISEHPFRLETDNDQYIKESRIPSPIQISIIASVLHPNVPNTPILSVEQPQN